jgi:hypothetical protein
LKRCHPKINEKEEDMKILAVFIVIAMLIAATGLPAIGGNVQPGVDEPGSTIESSGVKPSWEVPIAAGVWYPSDGPVPDHPMRYYRVRCWPGCHTGSSYGKYPQKTLDDTPIFPTSAASAHPLGPVVKE